VLTGSVVAIQQQNLLRGNQLVYEPKAGRMRLTSPAIAGRAPKGDVFVRFRPPARPGAKRRSGRNTAAGNAAGLTFNTNPDAPIEILAGSLHVDDTKSNALFAGSVRARQDGFLLTTPTLRAEYSGRIGLAGQTGAAAGLRKQPMKLRFIRASNPVEVTSGTDMQANGEQAVFDMAANTVTISGNVVLKRGRQVVRGEKLLIDLKSGLSRMLNAGPEKVTAKSLTFGAPPRITANPGQRDCGGKMCAVFFPRDVQKAGQGGKPSKNSLPARRQPSVGSGWSTSTSTTN
jgi:lipopolysaccharide transport protein LptA